MKRVKRVKEPTKFDERCRKRGQKWLQTHPIYDRPYDYWSEFEPELRAEFGGRCGYCAILISKGQVDHFIPVAVLKQTARDREAYEWTNFRYADGPINQKKHKKIVLDPFKVQDDWFEIQLPSLQLVLTAAVPKSQRALAEFTIGPAGLGLRDDESLIRYRRAWFEFYQTRQLTIDVLKNIAPLIAAAVERDLANNVDWRL
jgi:hypothetical protein